LMCGLEKVLAWRRPSCCLKGQRGQSLVLLSEIQLSAVETWILLEDGLGWFPGHFVLLGASLTSVLWPWVLVHWVRACPTALPPGWAQRRLAWQEDSAWNRDSIACGV
jgi:hypothetical protein